MSWLLVFLVLTCGAAMISLHYGVWARALEEFSESNIRNALQMASRIHDYEAARFVKTQDEPERLAYFEETQLFSQRQLEIIDDILTRTQKRTLGLGLALLFFLGWSTIFISHKIAGPLFRFRQTLKELAAKDLTVRARLRKYDEASDVADSLNEAIASLDESLLKIKRAARETKDPDAFRHTVAQELARFRTTQD